MRRQTVFTVLEAGLFAAVAVVPFLPAAHENASVGFLSAPDLGRWVLFGVLVFAALLVILWLGRSPYWRFKGPALAGWTASWPTRSLAIVAAIAVAASAYPVVFLGRSYVSPNLDANLLYNAFPTLPGGGTSTLGDVHGSDIGATLWQCVPYSAVQHQSLFHDHQLPLWNRCNSCGIPLLGQGQSMFGDPLHLLVIVTRGAAWAWDLKYLIAKWLFALGLGLIVYALTRHLPSALIVSLAAPFVGFFVYRVDHPAYFSLCYAPWLLYCWIRIAQPASRRALAGWSAGWLVANIALVCSGTVKEACVLLLAMNFSGGCVLLAAVLPWRIRIRRLIWMAWMGVLGVLLTAPIWYSFLETLRAATTNYDTASALQIQPSLLLGAFDEAFYRPLVDAGWVFNPSLNFLLLGGFLYFAATVRCHFSDRAAMALAASSLVPLGVAFGVVPPAWIDAIPFIGHVGHIDDTFSEVLIVLWAILAGLGFAAAARRLGRPEGRGDMAIAALLLGALLFEYLGFGHAVQRGSYGALHPTFSPLQGGQSLHLDGFLRGYLISLVAGLAGLGLITRRALQRGSLSAAQGLLLALCACLLLWRSGQQPLSAGFERYIFQPTFRPNFHAPSPAIRFVQETQREEPTRSIGLQSNFCPGWTGMYGLEGVCGPDAVKNPYYLALTAVAPMYHMTEWWLYLTPEDMPSARPFLDFLNVRHYFVLNNATAPRAAGLHLDYRADLEVYESPTTWPRAFFTDRVETYGQPADLMARILKDTHGRPFAAAQASELPGEPGLQALAAPRPHPATIVSAENYRMTSNTTGFEIHAPRPGIAVLAESYWPGYAHARVDGREARVVRINQAFEGILLDTAGNHRIEVTYRPRRFTLLEGIAVLGAALLLASGWILGWRVAPVGGGFSISAAQCAWIAAMAVCAAVAAMVSFPVHGNMVRRLPHFWYERARGWHYGPATWRLAMPARPLASVETLAETPSASLVIGYLPRNRARAGIRFADGHPTLWGEDFTYVPGELHQLSASFGSLYPASGHPYYIKHAYSPLERTALVVAWDEHVVLDGSRRLGPIDCSEIHLANAEVSNRRAFPRKPGWFSGGVLDVKRNAFAILSQPGAEIP